MSQTTTVIPVPRTNLGNIKLICQIIPVKLIETTYILYFMLDMPLIINHSQLTID